MQQKRMILFFNLNV